MPTTVICGQLGIEHPILSVGFAAAGGHELAAAVSNTGGLGVIGASSMPPDFLRERIALTRKLTGPSAARARFRADVARYQAGVPGLPPYHAYAAIAGTFLAGLGAISGFAAARNRPQQDVSAIDLAMLGLATFKASRVVSRDKVTSFVREPLVEGHAYDGGDEQPVQTGGMQQALGELVTCTRCIGTWIGAGLAATQVLAPRTGRLITSVLAAGALNDFLLAGFEALTSKASELEQRTGGGSG